MRMTTRSVSRRPMSRSSGGRLSRAARTSTMTEAPSLVPTGHGSTPAASPGRWRGRAGRGVLGASAVVVLAVAAVLLVGAPAAVAASPDVAAGDPGEVAKAKIAFKSAAIGYALAALAPLVVTVLQGIVGA